jgi:hypothetical protein
MVPALTCCFFFRRGTAAAWLRHFSIHSTKTITTTYPSRRLVVRQKTVWTVAVAKIPPSTTTTTTPTFGHDVLPPQRIPYSLDILKLRQQVMWPDQPLEYSSVEGDEEESTLHFGIYVTSPSSSSSLLLPINTELPTSLSSSSSSSSSLKDEPIQSKTQRLCSVVSVWINADGTDAQFRKFCTDTAWQGQGLGTSLLKYTFQELLLGWNNNNNNNNHSYNYDDDNNNNNNNATKTTTAATTPSSSMRRIWCNARVDKCHFYAKPPFDMVPIEGSEFVKGGRDYRLMERVCVCVCVCD